MSGGYAPKNVQLWEDSSTQTYSGVVTNQVLTKEFPITNGGSLNFVVKAKLPAVTQVGTITLKLQSAIDSDWVDSKASASITASGDVYIKLNVEVTADQTYLPLLSKGRLVLTTTNAGDSVTLGVISVLQEI